MAQLIKSKFRIIAAPASEFLTAGFGGGDAADLGMIKEGPFTGFSQIVIEPGKVILCDRCNEQVKESDTCYYIAVLNHIYCEKCFHQWQKNATFYSEDIPYEIKNFKYVEAMLNEAGIDVFDPIELPTPKSK